MAFVLGGFGGDSGAPQGAFVVNDTGGVGAAHGGVGVYTGVSLHVDVEGGAEVIGITQLLALDSVV